MNKQTISLRKQISYMTWFFMVSLAMSGLSAIPAKTGISFLLDTAPHSWTTIYDFLMYIRESLYSCREVLFYGYDWLAFAHVVIAVLFIGVLRDPVRNIWVIEFGMIACILIIPFAFIMGAVRGIPIWWRLVDCSFGVIGMLPLLFVRSRIKILEKVIATEKLNTIF